MELNWESVSFAKPKSLYSGNEETFVLSTENDQLFCFKDGNWKIIPGKCEHASIGDDGDLWFNSEEGELYHYENEEATKIEPPAPIKMTACSDEDHVLAVTLEGGLLAFEDENWMEIEVPGSISCVDVGEDGVRAIIVDKVVQICLPETTEWIAKEGLEAEYISLGDMRTLFAVNSDGDIFHYAGEDDGWVQKEGKGKIISISGDGTFMSLFEGKMNLCKFENPEPEEEEKVEEEAIEVEVDAVSKFNSSYYCHISKVEINPGEYIKITFDVHGNMRLGPLQPPFPFSRLWKANRGGKPTKPIEMEAEVNEPMEISGVLTFPYIAGPLFFQYGKFGYNRCSIYTPEPQELQEIELEDVKSAYNDNYYCDVKKVGISKFGHIDIHFEIHGDGSLGRLQNPKYSKVYNKQFGGDRAQLRNFEEEERDENCIKGILTYAYINGPLFFQFGRCGYRRTKIFTPE